LRFSDSNTSDKDVLSDGLDLFGCIKMPLWLNICSTGALDAGIDNASRAART